MSQRLVTSSPSYPKKIQGSDFITLDLIFALIAFGEPRSGKGVFMDWVFDHMYKNHFFCASLFSATGHESLFPMVNMNCKDAWFKEIQKNPSREHELPSCMCSKAVPILWIKPNYVEINKKSLEYGMNVVWKDWKEYNEFYEKNIIHEYISPWHWDDAVKSAGGSIKKPRKLYPKQIFKTIDFTPPVINGTTIKNREQFIEDMLKAVEICKKENRPLINSPGAFPTDHIGKLEKYSTVAQFLTFTEDYLTDSDLFKIYQGDRESASPQQLANHKKFYMFNELRQMAPSAKLSGEKESGVSKRAMYNFVPIRRHCKVWIGADSQSSSDVFDGVRNQFSSLKVFKRITLDLIGAENEKFFARIEDLVKKKFEWFGLDPNRVPNNVKLKILRQWHICKLSELPDNYYYIKQANGNFQFRKVEHARFHHKSDILDEITDIIDSKITINHSLRAKTTEKSITKTESVSKLKSQDKDTVMLRIKDMSKDEFPEWIDKRNEIKRLELDGSIPDLGNGKLEPRVLGNKFNTWLKNQ